MRTVYCRACEKALPVKNFYPGRIGPRTKRDMCKACGSKSAHEWNLAHPDRHRESKKRYNSKHPEAAAEWRRENAEGLRAALYAWREANPTTVAEISKRYRQKNLQKILVRNREREILEGRALPPWADREAIQAIYLEAKRRTAETGEMYHVDHIVPLKGKNVSGLHVETNLQVLLAHDNLTKFNKFSAGDAA